MPLSAVADQILWAQRIGKESVNAKARPGGFSVRSSVSVADVPSKFKPGHMDPRESVPSGAVERFDAQTVGFNQTMATEFRRCMNRSTAGPRDRHQFPETTQQELGWIQARRGLPQERSEPAGSKPTLMGVGWLDKEGHHGLMGQYAAQIADKESPDPAAAPKKWSKDGNVREEMGVPPYATSHPCARHVDVPPPPPKRERPHPGCSDAGGARSNRSKASNKSKAAESSASAAKQNSDGGIACSASLPALAEQNHHRLLERREKALGKAMEQSRKFLNGQPMGNKWYVPLASSDVALFADAYTKAWKVPLFASG